MASLPDPAGFSVLISLRRFSAASLNLFSRSSLSRSIRAFFSSKRTLARSAASESCLRA